MQLRKKKDITYKADNDDGLIEFFIDGKLFDTWCFEDEPEDTFESFMRIYNAGYSEGLHAPLLENT